MMVQGDIGQHKGLILKIVMTWLAIFALLGFFIATRSSGDQIIMSVMPEIPRVREPVVVTFDLNNPDTEPSTRSYRLYANGSLVGSGTTIVAPQASAKYQYAHTNYLERGEQVSFFLEASSDNGNMNKMVSLPPYPPQLMSSFVSFAAFSTSVMSSMLSMEYFD